MKNRPESQELVSPLKLEMIGDLIYSPNTDIPFGKRITIGLNECTIYESVIEKSYQIGLQAHLGFLKDHKRTTPVIFDDKQFTMVIEQLLPDDLSSFEEGLWRSFFIAGWMSLALGIVSIAEE